jgi:hypothetical protein
LTILETYDIIELKTRTVVKTRKEVKIMDKAMKMTNVKALDYVLENCDLPSDVREKLENMKAVTQRKNTNSGERKETPDQIKNKEYMEKIVEFLDSLPADSEGATCTEILKGIPELNENFQVQKVSGLVRKLRLDGRVTSKEVKGKPLYSLC